MRPDRSSLAGIQRLSGSILGSSRNRPEKGPRIGPTVFGRGSEVRPGGSSGAGAGSCHVSRVKTRSHLGQMLVERLARMKNPRQKLRN